MTAGLDIIDGELAYRGFAPHVTEIQGSLALADGGCAARLQAIFLDGPVTASVAAAGVPGYRARIDLEGEVAIDAVVDAFSLPYGERLAGQTGWQGSLLLPAAAGAQSLPAKITVDLESVRRGAAFPRAVRESRPASRRTSSST